MTVIHIVLFKFLADTPSHIKTTFIREVQALKYHSSVLNQRLVVGGPSITDPIARSKGFEICLLSYHRDKAALAAYQSSPEHGRVTKEYMWPWNEDLVRFDFEVEDGAVDTILSGVIGGIVKDSGIESDAAKLNDVDQKI